MGHPSTTDRGAYVNPVVEIRSNPLPQQSAFAKSEGFWFVTDMRIAVLADTHDRYPPGLPHRLQGADEIWHLGDVCAPAVLVEFEQLGPVVRVVRGNCDWDPGWPLELNLDRGGVRFLLTHIPPVRVPPQVQVVMHGHTHVPRDETDPAGVRWLNPGCISRPQRGHPPRFAWLTVDAGRIEWRLMPLELPS